MVIKHSARVRCATCVPVAVAALLAIGVAGCDRPEASATNRAATRAATTQDDPAATFVGIALREAEDEVLTWLDPTREPRIEWSRYVSRPSIADVWDLERWGLLYDRSSEEGGGRTPDELPDPVLLVVASTRGIEGLTDPRSDAADLVVNNGTAWLHGQTGSMAVSPRRVVVYGMFDPQTGERLAARVGTSESESHAALRGLPTVDAVVRSEMRRPTVQTLDRLPTATAIDPAVSASMGARLTQKNLPAGLAPTFRAYPLAPGSWSTWRLTHVKNDVRWVAEVLTETVEAAWLDGEHAVVQSRVEVQSLTPERNRYGSTLGTDPGPRLRYISADFIAASKDDFLDLTSWQADWPRPDDSPFGAAGVALEGFIGLLPSPITAATSVREGSSSIVTEAGGFPECWAIDHIGGASWGSTRRFCPGAGTVQYALGAAAGTRSQAAVAELIRWHRAELPQH